MKLKNWRQQPDGDPDLVHCLDFPGRRAVRPATVASRTHECGTDERLACTLRELIG